MRAQPIHRFERMVCAACRVGIGVVAVVCAAAAGPAAAREGQASPPNDPVAAEAFEPVAKAFSATLSGAPTAPFVASWFSPSLQEVLGGGAFEQILACRRATLGTINQVERLGATLEADGASGSLVLGVHSQARPLQVKLFLVRHDAGWRIDGMELPPALPVNLPEPARVEARVRAFLDGYETSDWTMALADPSVDFEMARQRLRPARELEIKRGMLGRTLETGSPRLSFDDRGIITATLALRLERCPATLRLSYAVCGDRLTLNGYDLEARPETPIEIPADHLEKVLELELWRSGYGDVEVSCTGFTSVRTEPGDTAECRAARAGEVVRALVTFENMAGGFEMEMKALD